MSTEQAAVLQEADITWGSSVDALKLDQHLEIIDEIFALPENATVLNLGSGVDLDIQAALYAQRPDLQYIALDSGYRLSGARKMIDASLELIISSYDTDAQAVLDAGNGWNKNLVAGIVQELPFADESVDYVFSHACIASHVQDASVLSEISRVLKPDGRAVVGPLTVEADEKWRELVEQSVLAGEFSGSSIDPNSIAVSGRYWDVTVTRLQK